MANLRLNPIAAALLIAATLPSGTVIAQSAPYNLIEDGGFEHGKSGFAPNQGGTSAVLTQTNPISGAQSLVVGIRGYGDSVLWSGRSLDAFPQKRSALLSVNAHLRATAASKSSIMLCGLVDYVDGSGKQTCARVAGTVGDKGKVSVAVALDNTRDIALVRVGLFQEGSAAISGLQVDDVSAVLDGVAPAAGSGSGTGTGTGGGATGGGAGSGGAAASGANLLSDGGFETSLSGMENNQQGTYVTPVATGALSGTRSLAVGMAGYGDSVLWAGRGPAQLSARRSSRYTVSAHLKMTMPSSSRVNLCAMAAYDLTGEVQQCVGVSGSAGDKGTVTVAMPLDAAKDLAGVRFGLFQEGGDPISQLLVDEVVATLDGVTPVGAEGGANAGGSGSGASGGGSDGNTGGDGGNTGGSTAGGTPYPGHSYTLPGQRPFIAMNQYDGSSTTSPAYQRLKSAADAAAAATSALAAGATYKQLVNALDYDYSAVDSIIMYRLSGDAKYLRQAVRMVSLYVASEKAAIAAGGVPAIAGDSYLELGSILEQLALAYDYGYALISAEERASWEGFAGQALSNLWNPGAAQWGGRDAHWSGWSLNDPGDNYYYSFLKGTMLWALATQNSQWITFLQQQKFSQLVPYYSLLTGGGSREGTGYGTALGNLFENYLYWKSSTGEDLSALSSHARDTVDYWIHATVPTLDYYAAIGDQSRSSMPRMFDYQRKLVLEGVTLVPGTEAAARGAWWLRRAKLTDGGNGNVIGSMRYNFDYRYDLLTQPAGEQAPTALWYDAAGAGVVFARSDWSEDASWLSFVAGAYDQSHAHQDQGSFAFYRNNWLAVTPNIYSKSGLHAEIGAHNVVRFDTDSGTVGMNYSTSTRTVSDFPDLLTVSANLAPAYSGHAQQVQAWDRTLQYQRSTHTLTVHDQCQVGSGVKPVWQLQVAAAPLVQADGAIVAGGLVIRPVKPAAPIIKLVDMRTVSSDFTGGYRIELTAPSGCEFQVDLHAK